MAKSKRSRKDRIVKKGGGRAHKTPKWLYKRKTGENSKKKRLVNWKRAKRIKQKKGENKTKGRKGKENGTLRAQGCQSSF